MHSSMLITANPVKRSERFRRYLSYWELFIRLFIPYYNNLRE